MNFDDLLTVMIRFLMFAIKVSTFGRNKEKIGTFTPLETEQLVVVSTRKLRKMRSFPRHVTPGSYDESFKRACESVSQTFSPLSNFAFG